jgi:hypothetical protein
MDRKVSRVKKTKQPGDNISLKTKKTEDPAVMSWINAQTNLMDSLRYLIELEIRQNGIRNLQAYIPAERNLLSSQPSPPETERPVRRLAPNPVSEPEAPEALQEVDRGREEASAGQAVENQGETPLSAPSSAPPPAKKPEASLSKPHRSEPKPEPAAEDEIDDEDIEAWV